MGGNCCDIDIDMEGGGEEYPIMLDVCAGGGMRLSNDATGAGAGAGGPKENGLFGSPPAGAAGGAP